MGMIWDFVKMVFGGGRNVVAETAEVFRENAEAGAQRGADLQTQAMIQLTAEFQRAQKGWFDRFMDGVNRVPRPALALGTLALFIAAMVDPIWFAERMQGLALVPEPLWWLLGVIVSFYFGARHQAKTQEFQKSIATTIARTPQVVENIASIRALRSTTPGVADTKGDAELEIHATKGQDGANEVLVEWKRLMGRSAR